MVLSHTPTSWCATYLSTYQTTNLPTFLPTNWRKIPQESTSSSLCNGVAVKTHPTGQFLLPASAPWKLKPSEKKKSHWNTTNPPHPIPHNPPPHTHTYTLPVCLFKPLFDF